MSEQQATEATETEASTTDEQTEQATEQQPVTLPDDHPLVKAYTSQKDQIRELKAQVTSAGDGQKTAEERLAALEQRAVKAERAALIKSIQATHGISDEDAELFLTGDDAGALTKQAQRLAAREDERIKAGNHVPAEGRGVTPPALNSNGLEDALKSKLGIS